MPTLRVISPAFGVREYELKDKHSIGRHESNSIQLTEDKASRMHCTVRLEGGKARAEDLNSANGLFVNGHRVASQILDNNDRITIGATTIIFCDEKAEVVSRELPGSLSEVLEASAPPSRKTDLSKVGRAETALIRPSKTRRPGSSFDTHGAILKIGFLVLVWVGYRNWGALMALTAPQDQADASAERAPAKPVEKKSVPEAPSPELVVKERVAAPDPKLMADQLKSVLAARDRALGSGNLLGAKAALQSFLAVIPPEQANDESVKQAKLELEETTRVANAAFDMSLKQAREALIARHFHVVSQRCTSLLSNDPHGSYGKTAREMLERIDEQTAQTAANAKAKAQDAIARGQLVEAKTAAESVIGELNGTRWAGEIDTLQFQLIMAIGFLEKIEAARAKRAASGERVMVTYSAKKIVGRLQSMNGLQMCLRVGDGQIEMPITLKNLETRAFMSMLDVLELSDHHAELACLWNILGRPDDARKQSEAALKESSETPSAVSLAGMADHSKNLHFYDFKNWRQLLDWEPVSGSWLSQDGKYVLETPDGGETALKTTSIGGPFSLDSARVGFAIEIRKPSPGWFFMCDLGDEKQGVDILFTATDVTIQDKAEAKSKPANWTPGETRVDVSIKGDTVTLTLDGKPAGTLKVPGISKQKGTIAFRAQQCGCAIDNVVLRTQE